MSKLAPVFSIPKTRVVEREREILRLCRDKKILHVGCADTPYTIIKGENLLHKRISMVANDLWGLDICPKGSTLLREMGFKNIITGNISEFASEIKKEAFDIILAGEVIEHVNNPGDFLKGIAEAMAEGTELLLTTVNTPSMMSFLFSLFRKEKVHPDHNYYFSYYTLKHLMLKCGFSTTEIYYYKINNTVVDKMLACTKYISPVLSDGIIVRASLRAT